MSATPAQWVEGILENFDSFLQDHANCERKASALAMSQIVKHPDRTEIIAPLIAIAQEELAHFRDVYELMAARGLRLVKDEPDPYVNALIARMRHGRDERFLDRMLVFSVVERRGAERFGLLQAALSDPGLKAFYRRLWGAEMKHGHQFLELVLPYFDEDDVYRRLGELAADEAEIVRRLPWRASLH